MQEIYITGGAMTPFGRHPGVLAPELAQQAILEAMDDAGVSPRDIQAVYCANVLGGMIRDRAFALVETSMFAPRYLRHIIGNQAVLSEGRDGTIRSRANYVVLQVLFDRPDATLHQVGVYYDVFRRVDGALKLAERRCVYDNLLVPNALCIPV